MMRVQIDYRDEMHFVATDDAGVSVPLDSSPDHGGRDRGATPMELLLMGLGGCTAMDVISILRKKRQDVVDYRIEVTGNQRDEYPRIFTEITVRHIVTGHNVSDEAVRRAIELSEEKYCPAYAMLKEAATIRSSFEVREAEGQAVAR